MRLSTKRLSCGNDLRPEPAEIWKARNYICENLTDKISLHEVAAAVNICPTYLSERFKEVTGEKFVRYVARARVEHARNLLDNSKLRICEIAFASGFQSISQFNRVFKGIFGQSPSEFRTQHGRRSRRIEEIQTKELR